MDSKTDEKKPYPLITITGADRCGKETQTNLLVRAIQPSTRIEFPDYRDFAGQAILGALFGQEMSLVRYGPEGPVTTSFRINKKREPHTFQLLQNICRFRWQERINDLLEYGYVIADRYQIDALAYGTADGCDLKWLLNLLEPQVEESLAIIFVGKGYPKPGVPEDCNEKDRSFQADVLKRYRSLAALQPERYRLFDVDRYQNPHDPVRSIYRTHTALIQLLNEVLDQGFTPLTFEAVEVMCGQQSPQMRLPVV